MIRRIVLVGFHFFTVRIDLYLQLQLQVHKKLFHFKKYPNFDPSSLATIGTWEAETCYAYLCYIDLGPQKVLARPDTIYEIRILLWAYIQYHEGPGLVDPAEPLRSDLAIS